MEFNHVAKLVRDFKNGDEKSFDKLYSSLYSGQYYYALKIVNNEYTAEDMVQETFVKAYKNINQLIEDKSFIKWITRINYCNCVEFLKKNSREVMSDNEVDYLSTEDANNTLRHCEDTPEEAYIKGEKSNDMEKLISSMPIDIRSAVVLKYYNGFKEREIAEILDIPVGTVKSRLFNAKKLLSKRMTGIRSFIPITCLIAFFAHDAGALMLLPGAIYVGSVAKTVVASSVTAAVLLTAMNINAPHNAPQITSVDMLNYNGPTACQSIGIKAVSVDEITSVLVDGAGESIPCVYEDGTYKADIYDNGTYVINVTDNKGKVSTQDIVIDNIDAEAPDVQITDSSSDDIVISLKDAKSGIDWDSVKVLNNKGVEVKGAVIDSQAGNLICSSSYGPIEVSASDMAGNTKSVRVDYR